jgi:secretion/DNA translocation related TadE-like protein
MRAPDETVAIAGEKGEVDGDAHGRPVARRDRGSASIWVVACCALLLAIAAAAALRASAVLTRHRAEAAADLAALAAAGRLGTGTSPCPAAARVAAANHAVLRACRPHLDAGGRAGTVDVQVQVDLPLPVVGRSTVTATARAGRLSTTPGSGPAAAAAGLFPVSTGPGRALVWHAGPRQPMRVSRPRSRGAMTTGR